MSTSFTPETKPTIPDDIEAEPQHDEQANLEEGPDLDADKRSAGVGADVGPGAV